MDYAAAFNDKELMDEFLVCAEPFVERFYLETFPDIPLPPVHFVDYNSEMAQGCTDSDGVNRPANQYSAFYCQVDEAVFLGAQGIYDEYASVYGDMSLFVTLAHEFAHYYQDMSGRFDRPDSNTLIERRYVELQADCLAGAWARYAERRGELLPDDFREALEAMIHYASTNHDSRDHGSASERTVAFQVGWLGGREVCDAYGAVVYQP